MNRTLFFLASSICLFALVGFVRHQFDVSRASAAKQEFINLLAGTNHLTIDSMSIKGDTKQILLNEQSVMTYITRALREAAPTREFSGGRYEVDVGLSSGSSV